MKQKPRINIQVDDKLKNDVKIKATLQGKTITNVVVKLLKKWLTE